MKYNEKKAAQVAAYFIYREGGQVEVLKLMKLMYLAERESLSKYGEPIIGDDLVSMQHGPVLSITLDHVNDFIKSEQGGWNEWISDRENHFLALKKDINQIDSLLELSDADIGVLGDIFNKFGQMSAYEIRDYTHEHCDEWEDPSFSSSPIPYARVLKCIGHSAEAVAVLTQRINEQRKLDNLFNMQVGTIA